MATAKMGTVNLFICYLMKLGSAYLCAGKPIYWHQVLVQENAVFIARLHKEHGQLMLKRPEFPSGFQGRVFKGKVREASCSVCDQLVHNSLIGWWFLIQDWLPWGSDDFTGFWKKWVRWRKKKGKFSEQKGQFKQSQDEMLTICKDTKLVSMR